VGAAIVGCEISFWLFVAGGLLLRYRLHRPRAGLALLAAAPGTDVVLLILLAVSLGTGAIAGTTHGLAAVYLGVSVAFGRDLVAAADVRMGGPAAPRRSPWGEWFHVLTAGVISAAILLACVLAVGDPARTEALIGWLPNIGLVVGVWLLYPVSVSARRRLGTSPAPDACRCAGVPQRGHRT
jgi:hypothetical protein